MALDRAVILVDATTDPAGPCVTIGFYKQELTTRTIVEASKDGTKKTVVPEQIVTEVVGTIETRHAIPCPMDFAQACQNMLVRCRADDLPGASVAAIELQLAEERKANEELRRQVEASKSAGKTFEPVGARAKK